MINFIKKIFKSGINITNIVFFIKVYNTIVYVSESVKEYFLEMFKQENFLVFGMFTILYRKKKIYAMTTTTIVKKKYFSSAFFIGEKNEEGSGHPILFLNAVTANNKAIAILCNKTHSKKTSGHNILYEQRINYETGRDESIYIAVNKLICWEVSVNNINIFFKKFFGFRKFVDKNLDENYYSLNFSNEIIQRINSIVEVKYNEKIFIDYTLVGRLQFFGDLFKDVVNFQKIKNQNQIQNHAEFATLKLIITSINNDYAKVEYLLRKAFVLFPEDKDLDNFKKSSLYKDILYLLLLNKNKYIAFNLILEQKIKTNKDKFMILFFLEHSKYKNKGDKYINGAIYLLFKGKGTIIDKKLYLAYLNELEVAIYNKKINKSQSNNNIYFD